MVNLDIVYEDNHLLVVNKDAGLLTQPTDRENDSVETRGKAYLKEKYGKPGNVFLEATHRLDRPASGLVALARTSKALSRLMQAVREGRYSKTYLAIVEGIPPLKGLLEHWLIHGDYRAIIAEEGAPGAKMARMHYKRLSTNKGKSLLEIDLETGRYHQIRAQLSAEGFPIVGDVKYGSKKNLGGIIALHHWKLTLPHPTKKGVLLGLEAKFSAKRFGMQRQSKA